MTSPKSRITVEFLREVQARGWVIETATTEECVGRCPTNGCSVRSKLRPGASIPVRVKPAGDTLLRFRNMAEGAAFLRAARAALCLTADEVELAAGLTSFHVLKGEADPPRMMNVDTFADWASAIGFDLALVPKPLPPLTLRIVEETREKEPARRRHGRFNLSRDGRSPRT